MGDSSRACFLLDVFLATLLLIRSPADQSCWLKAAAAFKVCERKDSHSPFALAPECRVE